MSVTHVAGPACRYNDRMVQRCMVCGEKLIDSKDAAVVCSSGEPPNMPVFGVGHMVRIVEEQNGCIDCRSLGPWVNENGVVQDLPDDNCFPLVE